MSTIKLTNLADDARAALEWWQLAGVDCDYEEEAINWLAEAETTSPLPQLPSEFLQHTSPDGAASKANTSAPSLPAIVGDAPDWGDDLASFQAWWMAAKALNIGGHKGRVPPRGAVGAELMILVAMPEEADDGTLLSGPFGQMLTAFLGAAGVETDKVYFASTLPAFITLPDYGDLAARGLGKALLHHITLVEPKRVLIFGRNIPPLLGNALAQGPRNSLQINHSGAIIMAMNAATPSELLRSAERRKRFWQQWLAWTSE